MKTTLRLSDRPGFIQIRRPHYLKLDMDTLVHIVAEEFQDQEGKRLRRSRVEKAVRNHIFRQGGETMDWDHDQDDPTYHWAREQVVRLWPGLAKNL